MNQTATPTLAASLSSLPWDFAPSLVGEPDYACIDWPALGMAPEPLTASASHVDAVGLVGLVALSALLQRYGQERASPLLIAGAKPAQWHLWQAAPTQSFEQLGAQLEGHIRGLSAAHLGEFLPLCDLKDPVALEALKGQAIWVAGPSQHEQALHMGRLAQAPWIWLSSASGPGRMLYDQRRFAAATMARSLGHWQRLVAAAQSVAGQAWSEVPLLSTQEQSQAVETAAQAHEPLPAMTALLYQRARSTPHACAYRWRGQTVSFVQLLRWVNALEKALRQQGMQAGEPVAVAVERSPSTVAAILAIWCAGGSYLPIDVDYPADYVGHLLSQCGAKLAIAEPGWDQRLRERGMRVVVNVPNSEFWALAAQPTDCATWPLPAAPDVAQSAAIFYTSGSTGKPKGVVHSHAAVHNRMHALFARLPVTDADCLSQRTNVGFIPSLGELLSAVATGRPTVVVPNATARDPDALAELICAEGITRMGMVPTLAKAFLNQEGTVRHKAMEQLRLLSLAGEVLTADTATALRNAFPRLRVVNDYGSTETNGVLIGELADWCDKRPAVPAGRPIANVQALVLDAGLLTQPCNVEGDLYIAGLAVGQGYLDRPEETERRYLEVAMQPLGAVQRVYCTGDRAKRLPDGQIEVLGRGDNVVKVNGNRVELEGVEAVLQAHPNVFQAAATIDPKHRRLCALLVPRPDQTPPSEQVLTAAALRAYLRAALPPYMVPSQFTLVSALPRTVSGKLDRARLKQDPPAGICLPVRPRRVTPATVDEAAVQAKELGAALCPAAEIPPTAAAPAQDAAEVLACIEAALRRMALEAGLPPIDPFEPQADLQSFGLDSMGIVNLAQALSQDLAMPVTATDLFDLVTPAQLAQHLAARTVIALCAQAQPGQQPPLVSPAPAAGVPAWANDQIALPSKTLPQEPANAGPASLAGDDIAIVGLAAQLPGAHDLQAFWQLVQAGASAITTVPPQRWDSAKVYQQGPAVAGKSISQWGGFLGDIASFDPAFFGLTAGEAKRMDPQQRLLLQCAWHALEDAGWSNRSQAQAPRIGVYVGARAGDYRARLHEAGVAEDALSLVGNDQAVVAGRVAYHLNLGGPAMTVDTACSSSLVALHLACQALRAGDCELALAAGVSLMTGPEQHVANSQAGMLSPQGRCATLSDQADGFVQGEGVAAVVLKPLAKALADGDRVWAVVKASAVNQDGHSNGITAPNGRAQKALLQTVYGKPGLAASSVQLIELHGTGTRLGDPIEVLALAEGLGVPASGHTWVIGSVKANVGHLIAAAGMAGLVKVVLALQAARLPPGPRPQGLNPDIPFQRLPFQVLDQAQDWVVPQGQARRAGISAFGFCGTNAHVVLEQAPNSRAAEHSESRSHSDPKSPLHTQWVPLVAFTREALQAQAQQWLQWLLGQPQARLHDLAYSAQMRAHNLPVRAVLLVATRPALVQALEAVASGASHGAVHHSAQVKLPVSVAQALLGAAQESLSRAGDRDEGLKLLATAIVAGVQAPWPAAGAGQLLSLPGQVFARQRCWADPKAQPLACAAQAPEAALAAAAAAQPAGRWLGPHFTVALSGEQPVLSEHQVRGKAVLPGAAPMSHVLQALARQQALDPATSIPALGWELTQVVWPQALSLGPQESATLSGTATVDEPAADTAATRRPNQGRFEAHASGLGAAPLLVAKGRWSSLQPGDGDQAWPRLDIEAVLARCATVLAPQALYQTLQHQGLHYGPSYRRMKACRTGGAEALAWVDLGPEGRSDRHLQPEQLDALLHCATAVLLGDDASASSPLPFTLGRLRYSGVCPPQVLVYVHRHPPVGQDGATACVDLMVCDEQGHLVLQVEDLVLRRQPSGSVLPAAPAALSASVAPANTAADATLMWSEHWAAAPLRAPEPAVVLAQPARPATVLWHGPAEYLGPLQRHGAGPSARPSSVQQVWSAHPADEQAWQREQWLEALNEHNPQVLVRVLDGSHAQLQAVHASLLAMAQACASRPGAALPAVLLLCTAQAEAAASAASGFLRAWAAEAASLRWRVLHVMPPASRSKTPLTAQALQAAHAEVADLAAASPGHAAADELRWHPSHGRLRHGWRPWTPPVEVTSSALPQAAVCVITGGLGGAGDALAHHLVQVCGARIALVGRSAPDPRSNAALAALRAQGTEACYAQADLADRQSLELALSTVRKRFGRIDAVFHTAGLARDAWLADKTAEQAHEVTAAKVDGARWLDELTAADALSAFVLFSSVSAALGSPGQTDYAFANRCLDALAQERAARVGAGQRSGKTLSVNWPLLAVGRMRPSTAMQAHLRQSLGMAALPGPAMGQVLQSLLHSSLTRVLVIHGHAQKLRLAVSTSSTSRTTTPGASPTEGAQPVGVAQPEESLQ